LALSKKMKDYLIEISPYPSKFHPISEKVNPIRLKAQEVEK